MGYILFFIAGIALGMYLKKSATTRDPKKLDEMRKDAHKSLTKRTEDRKEKILEMLRNENVLKEKLSSCSISDEDSQRMLDGKITCADVEKLLDVSGGTARKYLNELENENKIQQIGKSGRDVYYTLNP